MKLFISLEIDVEDLPAAKGASNANVEDFLNMLKVHTSHVVQNFEGTLRRFDIEKA